MEYWDVFIVIGAVISLFATVLPFFTKLNRTLGELNATVTTLREIISNSDNKNRETHTRIFKKLDDHETRISKLE